MKKLLILCVSLFLVFGVLKVGYAAPIVTFDLPVGAFGIGDTISVGITLTLDSPAALQSGGGFFDFDDTFMTFDTYIPGAQFPLTVAGPEIDIGWHTAAGWAGKGYAAPSFFEEGPDLLVASIGAVFPVTGTVFDLGTANFTALMAGDPGDILISWLDRPNTDDFVLADGTVLDPINATTVPIPSAVLLFGSGLLALVGIQRRRKN